MESSKKKFEIIENVKCYAPKLALQNNNYPVEAFKNLFAVEEKNFWFISRNRVIQHFFQKYVGTSKADILEIGCGTGYVLKGLHQKFKNYNLVGSEIHLAGIKFAKKRVPNLKFIQIDATNIPFVSSFDAIGAFDVLEHIEDDEKVIQEVFKSLKSQGYFIISVPQYEWMWSINDDLAHHKRRYSRNELNSKLLKAGFVIDYLGSFVFTLFPLMYISRLLKKKSDFKKGKKMSELELNPFVNNLFLKLMKLDEKLIEKGISLPYGGSLFAVARKI